MRDLFDEVQDQARVMLGIGVPRRIFVCSPLRGDYDGNVMRARHYCRCVLSVGHIPFAPHLLFPQFLDDTNPQEREIGINLALHELTRCDELWAFVPASGPTDGMQGEIDFAKKRGITVRELSMESKAEAAQ